jgi:hypothetical protein
MHISNASVFYTQHRPIPVSQTRMFGHGLPYKAKYLAIFGLLGAILTTYVRLYSRYHNYYYSSRLCSTVRCPVEK